MIYSDKSVSSIILQSELNDINVNSETNAVFNLLKILYFCLVHCYKTLSINFIKSTITSVKNLMNCQ